MHTLPTVVIGGWLGAGKTTLVNHLLRHAGGRRVAVLVNDFGSIGIDADLIAADAPSSAGVLQLAGGCLCCSFGDDLVGTLDGLARRQPPPDVVLIELSGVALPAAVVGTARLSPAVQVVGTLVLADASDVRRRAQDRYVGDTVLQQLADADWLWLSKPDLIDPATLVELQHWAQAQAPRARVWSGSLQDLWPELLLGWRHDEGDDAAAPWAPRSLVQAAQALHPPFDSHAAALAPDADLAALGERLAQPSSGVLRAKAVLGDRVLQVAAGRWAVSPARTSGAGRIVLIGLRGRWDPQALLSPAADLR